MNSPNIQTAVGISNIPVTDMSHEEWLEERKKGIGGSDVPAILGFNPYRSALDVWFDKIGQGPKEPEAMNSRMKAGLKLEDVIAEWFEEETGLKVRRDNKIRVHKDIPYLLGNVDRTIIGHNGDGPGILEIKTTNGFTARNWDSGDVPLTYYAQLQHYLSVTGYTWGYFAVLVDGHDLRIYRQERDQEFIDKMNAQLAVFWEKVLAHTAPEPSSEEDIKKLYPRQQEGKVIPATPETMEVYKTLIEIKSKIKELEEGEQRLKEQLQLAMLDGEALEFEGKKIVTWKAGKDRSVFNKDKFQKDNPELYSTYVETQPASRTFLVKEIK